MNSYFLIFFVLLAIFDSNNAWNVKGQQQQQIPIPGPFRQTSKSVSYKQSGSYQQSTYRQDEASAEPTPEIPKTSFECVGKPYQPGMYADEETQCRVYHVCVDDRKESFFCGDGTVFNQKILTCDYPKDTDCAASQRYWSANEELGKPGKAEPGPQQGPVQYPSYPQRPIQYPVSRSQNTKQRPFKMAKGKYTQHRIVPQEPIPQQQYQPQQNYQPQQPVIQSQPVYPQQLPQQPQKGYSSYEPSRDTGFVSEPVKKLRPNYKVVKSQQQVSYQSNRNVVPGPVRVSPAKAKFLQEAIPLDIAQGQSPIDGNYNQQNYGQSDSYFSQQQTSGQGWQPSDGPVHQQPQQQQYSYSSKKTQTRSQKTYRQQSSRQQSQYSQQSDASSGWKPTNHPGGGYSSSDLSEKSIDINIPQTNFDCEGQRYEPGMYADMEVQCSIYHVCFDGRKETFACGGGTAFNQKLLTCDHIGKFKCEDTPRYYSVNENLINDQGTWRLKQASYSSGDGWSNNQQKIKK